MPRLQQKNEIYKIVSSASFIILYKHNLHKLPVTAGYEGAFTFSTLFPFKVLNYFQLGFIY